MNGTHRFAGCTNKNRCSRPRPLAVELLDGRLMMSVSPPLTVDPAAAELAEGDRAGTQLAAPDLVVQAGQAMTLNTRGLLPGGGAYPNPEDDDGDWGPLGPVVHEALAKIAETFAHQLAQQLAVRSLPGGGSFYPAPDDDGDWGPAGPVVHDALGKLAQSLAQQWSEQLAVRSLPGGGSSYPAPDDDGDWGPAGPVVRDLDKLYLVVRRDMLRAIAEDSTGRDPTRWTEARLRDHIQEKLVEWFRDPDPEPWVDVPSLTRILLGGGGAGYPAPDDDGGWGPAGPVVHGPLFTAGDANLDFRFDQRDIVQMLQGGKYLTGERATWKDGDFNGDRVFDQLDIVAAQQTDSYLRSHGPAEEVVVDLVYAGVER